MCMHKEEKYTVIYNARIYTLYFNCLGSMTNHASCTRAINYTTAMAKATLKRKTLFTSKLVLNVEETSEVLHLKHSIVRCWTLDTAESKSETRGKVLKYGDWEDQLDQSCEKWSITQSQGRQDHHHHHQSLGATALREHWPPVLFASTGLYPELSFSILQSPSVVGPLKRHLVI
jgi:hypothetical protein